MWEGFSGAIIGALVGAVIPSFVTWIIFVKERNDKIDEVKQGADRESNQRISNETNKSNQKIADMEITFNKEVQKENVEINTKLNDLIDKQNNINEEYKTKTIAIQDALRELRELEIENQKETVKVTKKIADDRITADIESKAIIDWIQNVRKVTSEYIAEFVQIIDEKKEITASLKFKKEILILYFGPDSNFLDIEPSEAIYILDNQIIISPKIEAVLLYKDSNEGKNEYIVQYIKVLTDFYSQPNYINGRKIYDLGEEIRDITNKSDFEVNTDENGEKYKHITPNEEQLEEIKDLSDQIDEINNSFKVDFSRFNDIMRLYLKIEWVRAKRGS